MKTWMGLGLALCLGACNDDKQQASDTSASDTNTAETTADSSADSAAETTPADSTPAETVADTVAETVAETTPDTTDDVTPGPYGFVIRTPRTGVEPPCDLHPEFDPNWKLTANDADYICTFAYGGATATVYFQSSPTGCHQGGMVPLPSFDTHGWVSKDGVVTALPAAHYDIGGNHHNDYLTFTLDGADYEYGHSSFGFGFRACAPPDCLQRLDASDHVTVVDDGCTPARSHPIVCQSIHSDGTFGSLADTFTKCPGDPNAK